MQRTGLGLRSMLVTGIVLLAGTAAGCGGSSGSSSTGSSTGTINRSTTSGLPIAGNPVSTAVVGQPSASKSNTVTLSWDAPTENSDGTALVDLKGYKLRYGSASKSYSDIIEVANPGLTTYVVQNLPTGKYYFALTAYNASGQESSLSGEVSTQVD